MSIVRVYLPLLLVGGFAGLLYTLSLRAATAGRRRALQLSRILVVLLGAPAWLFVATALGWM